MNNNSIRSLISIFLVPLVCLALLLCFTGDRASTKGGGLGTINALAPDLSATKTGALDTTVGGDANANGLVNLGDRLNYAVTIQSTGTDPAAGGVTLTDVIDPNTTLFAGSVIASPIAVNESYDGIGNVGITVPAAGGLLTNDLNPNGGGTLSITAVNQAGLQGTLSVNSADGSFTFNPNPGFIGPTGFSYTLSNGTGLTDTATVSISISGLIWFINNAGGNGDGRLGTPFSSIANFNSGAADDPGDNIFVYTGSGNYDGSITLLNNQRLIGQGSSSTLASIMGVTVPPFSNILPTTATGTNPTIVTTTAGSNAVNPGTGNVIRGVTIGNTTGAKINAAATVGTLTIGPSSGISDVTLNGTGRALNLTGGGTLAARFASISSDGGATGITLTGMGGNLESQTTGIQNSIGIGLNVSNSVAGGTFNFGSTTSTSSAGTGVFLSGNANNQTFTALNIAPDTNQRALLAQNNTGPISSTSGAIENSGIAAVEITNVSATVPLNIQLTSVSATGGANGIVLTNTSSSGSPGGFRILGSSSGICGGQVAGVPATVTAPNVADCTGGTIQNTTGAGILFTNVSNISLTRIRIANGQDDGVSGTNVTSFTLVSSLIENNGNAVAEQGLDFDNLFGTSSVSNSVIRLSHEHNVEVRNTTNNGSQATLSIAGSTINNASVKTQSDDGVLYVGSGTANMSITVSGCALFANRGDHLQAAGSETSAMNAIFINNTLTGGHSTALGQDIVVNGAAYTGAASFTYDINGNSINGAVLSAITADLGSPSVGVTMSGRIRNNTIGTTGVQLSCSSQSDGIQVQQRGGGTHTLSVTGNTMRQCKDRGMDVTTTGSGNLNMTVQSNSVLEGSAINPGNNEGSREAFILNGGATATDTNSICLQLGGAGALANNLNRGTEAIRDGLADIRLRKQTGANITIRLPGYGGGATDGSAVGAFVAGMNTSSEDGTVTVAATAAAPGGFVGGASCSPPPPIAMPINEAAVNAYGNSVNSLGFLNIPLIDQQLPFDFKNSKLKLPSSQFETVNDVEQLRQNAANLPYRAASFASNAEGPRCDAASSKTYAESLATYAALSSHYAALLPTYTALSPTYAAISPTYAAETQAYAASSVDYTASSATYAESPKTYDEKRAGYDERPATYAAQQWISEVVGKIGAAIMPTALAQESRKTRLSPESGETVTKALGTLPAGEQIVVQFKVTVDANIPTNDFSVVNTANITASGGININSTTATTTVVHPPTISKAFGSPSIALNGTTSLTFTIGNANPATAFTNVAFTDNLPAGLVVATPNGLVNNCGGGTISAVAGSSTISVSALSRPAASNCTIVVNVNAPSEGAKNNLTGTISSTQGGIGLTASASVSVITAPTFAKAFGAPTISQGGTTSLAFTITNNSGASPLNSVSFTDILPAGLVVATPNNQTGTCGGGTITASQGAGSISLSGATLAAGASCTFSADVTATSSGMKNNTVNLTTTELGTPSATAAASINVLACISNPVVNTTADTGAGSLRDALANVCTAPNNTISFNLTYPATLQLASAELNIGKDVNINGPGADQLEIRGSQTGAGIRVFNVPVGITANISGATITGGGTALGGAGVNNLGTLGLSACTVKGNQATGIGGGGILNYGSLTIDSCTISNNVTTAGNGGGILNGAAATLAVGNSTISTNTANAGTGGGISSSSTVAATISRSTVASNNADAAGTGGIANSGAAINIANTIVGDNTITGGGSSDLAGAFNSQGYNLIETLGTAVITGDTTGNIVADPRLGALLNYGGPTETHSLLIDSPALDAGNNTGAPALDQRGTGFSRVRDSADAGIVPTADIGAFEADPVIEDGTNKSTDEDVPLAVTFRVGDDVTGAIPFNAFTATSGNTTLVPVANIVFSGGSGANGSGISNTGQRTVTITPVTNSSGTATITIIANKTIAGTVLSMSDTFALTVNSVLETPSVTNGSTLEDTQMPSGQLLITPNALDGAAVTHFKITNISNGSLFQSNGTTAIASDSFISAADGAAGLRFTPSPNFFGNGSFNVTASSSASDAGLGGAPATATITVTGVNDAPTLTDPADLSVNEDSGLQTVTLAGITAGPLESQTLTVTASSDNTALIPTPTVSYTSPGATGSLSFTPAANQSGTANVTVTVTDNGGTANGGVNSFSQTFVVTINAVNDAPTLSDPPDVTILEDSALQTVNLSGITAGTNETQTLTVTASSDNTGLIPNPTVIYTSPNTNGSLTFTPVTNQSGTANVTVTVTDNGGTANGGVNTVSQVFLVTVTAVNDAPTLTDPADVSINEDAGLQTVNLTGITAGPNEVQTLAVTASSNNAGLIPNPTVTYSSPDSTGSLSFTPVANQSGMANITVTVTDNGGTANGGVNTFSQMFVVNVAAQNDTPTTTTIPDVTVVQNAANTQINLRNFFADVEDGSAGLVYTIQSNDNAGLFSATSIDNPTDVLTLDYSPAGFGVANITIRATDTGTLFVDDTFKVTVVAPPTVAKSFSPNAIAPGGTSLVTVTLANANNIGLAISGTFTDSLPANVTTTAAAAATTCAGGTAGTTAGSITLTGGTIPANGSCTLTATVTSTTPGVHTNTIAAGDVVTTNGGSNTAGASATLSVATPPTVAKAFTPTLIVPGDSSAVTITLGNTNAFALTNAALTDNLTANVTTVASTVATTCGGTISQLASSVSLANGTIPANGTCAVTFNVTSSVPGSYANSIAAGDLTTSGGPNTAPANATLEVRAADYGDAPDSYATMRAANGARHGVVLGFSLGATVDTEADGVPSAAANGDGADEDGVALPASPLVQGANATATVTLTNTASLVNPRLDAWIDFNIDGDFDAAERIATSVVLTSGANTVNFTTPGGAASGNTFARFRLSDGGGLNQTAAAATGEVEDYTAVINQPPVAGNVNVSGTEDQAGRIAIVMTATDTAGDAVTQFRIDTVPAGGQLFDASTGGTSLGAGSSVNAGGTGPYTATIFYQLNPNFNGGASFTYSAFDDSSYSAPATVAISIAAVNDPPTFALGANQTSGEDAGLRTVTAFASSISPGPADEVTAGQAVAAFNVSNNNNALFSAQPAIAANGTLTYTSASNAFGTATVTVSATDNGTPPATSAPLSFTITIDAVNDPPTFTKGADQTVGEDAGAQTVPTWATNISQGPLETGQTLTFNVTGNTNSGLFSAQPAVNPANGNLIYTPAANANGTATITLTLSDNGSNVSPNSNTSAPQTFVISVTAVNDPPSFGLGPNQSVNEDAGGKTVASFATAISPGPSDESGQTVAFNVTNNDNSLFSIQPAISPSGTLTYTPAPNAFGSATVSVTATDSAGATSAPAQTFTILVNAVNDAPVAAGDSYSTNEDTPLTVSAAGVLANDTDVDNTNAQLSVATPRPVTGPLNGTLTLNANGSFTYTPNANYFGADSFTYRASDGAATSNTATVSITVSAVNDPPVANSDLYSTNEDTQLVIAAASSGVLANDTDADHLNLQLTVAVPRPVSGPANGTLILNTNGTFTYTPNANFNGTDSFTYRASDGIANSNLATVTVTVNAVNDAPVANGDAYSGVEDTVLTIAARGVLTNDVDIDNTNAQLSVATPRPVSGPANGTLVLNADGSFAYTPNANFFGTDSFTYRASDGSAMSNIATVNLVISDVPDTVTISGNIQLSNGPSSSVPLAGATVELSGSQTQATVTDGIGNYSFTVTQGGSYTLTPSGLGKTYEPITHRYSNVAANITNAHFLAFDQGALQRALKLQNAYAVPGSPTVVSIDLTGPRGNERHFNFSLTYDAARLSSPVVTCGPDAPGCSISPIPGTPGELGINVSSATPLPPGDIRLLRVTFQTSPDVAPNTPILFSDSPVFRGTFDASGNPLFTGYTGGFVIFTEQGNEGDLAPRSSGDGLYRANDVELERNFVAGLATGGAANEFERADVAPYASKGDGQLNASDFQLVINYVAGLVNPQSAGGPDQPGQAAAVSTDDNREQRSLDESASREFRGVSGSGGANTFVSYPIDLTSTGEETVTTFSLQFDPTKLSITATSGTNNNPDVTLGSGANAGTSRTVNATQVADGRIGVLFDFQGPLQAGVRRIVVFRFRILPTAQPGFTPISFVGTPIALSTTNGNADPLTAQYVPGGITVLMPTAAGVEVGGRITTPDGRGLRNARVTLTDAAGNRRLATSSTFGYYRFYDIEAGGTYVIAVSSRRYRFAPRAIQVVDSITDLDFVGLE